MIIMKKKILKRMIKYIGRPKFKSQIIADFNVIAE